jgi:hypothetical protein
MSAGRGADDLPTLVDIEQLDGMPQVGLEADRVLE